MGSLTHAVQGVVGADVEVAVSDGDGRANWIVGRIRHRNFMQHLACLCVNNHHIGTEINQVDFAIGYRRRSFIFWISWCTDFPLDLAGLRVDA